MTRIQPANDVTRDLPAAVLRAIVLLEDGRTATVVAATIEGLHRAAEELGELVILGEVAVSAA